MAERRPPYARSTGARTGRSLDWRRTAVSPNTGTSPNTGDITGGRGDACVVLSCDLVSDVTEQTEVVR